ncbi:MAG: hypothetical protein MK102_12885 [Fuerstiella sp.]|nr:hypothetical protein [Fuerstiella sp.]
MKRFLTTMLTLVLFTGALFGKASAQNVFGLPTVNTAESGIDDIRETIIRFAATDVGIMDFIDLSWLGGQEGEDLVDLWFELVDAGYSEDEAFELAEMVMGSDLGAQSVGKFQAVTPQAPPQVRPEAPDQDCETYQDSNGGAITLCGDLGNNHGTYERKDSRGNVVSKGTWEHDRDGNLTYQGGAGYDQESGSATNTPDGYDYQGTDVNGNRERGLWS